MQLEARLQRFYPYGAELVHVLGYVGRISERDLERIDEDRYRGSRYIGKLGIESQYEDVLLGQVGYEQVGNERTREKCACTPAYQPCCGR